MLLIQPLLTSPEGRKNIVNVPSRKLKHTKPSMMSTTVDHNKVNADLLNKNKDELSEVTSKFKYMYSSISDDCSIYNWNALDAEIFNSLANPTFIQHLKSSINLAHLKVILTTIKLKGREQLVVRQFEHQDFIFLVSLIRQANELYVA